MNQTFRFRDQSELNYVLGDRKSVLKQIRSSKVNAELKGLSIRLSSDDDVSFQHAVRLLQERSRNYSQLDAVKPSDIRRGLKSGKEGKSFGHQANKVTPLQPKNEHQKEYLKLIQNNDITFGLGPAGTGKTFLAVAAAVQAYDQKLVDKIIITRPAVEAGEKLGFLPGKFSEKVDPYLTPIYDALTYFLGKAQMGTLRKDNIIEIAPIAYMRGRTLANSFILLDEAQNCTFQQLYMVLTRIGQGSKCVVTGDLNQSDIHQSGLGHMVNKLDNLEGISVYRFDQTDVVRHPVVARVIKAVGNLV